MFRLLGFDVRVRPGFVMFLGLIVLLYQDRLGVWLAAAIAGFTLLHELGHAVAARAAGADAAISLDFMAGYTSYRPRRPLRPAQRALITAAGPLVQIAVSAGVLVAMGVNPLSADSARQSDAATAIWWAGPVIGLLNLVPVLPLDGGHLVLTGLDAVIGERSLRVMAIASLAITGGAAVWLFGSGRGGFAIFVVFLLVNQLQLLQATSRRGTRRMIGAEHDAESTAWRTGQPGLLEPGEQLSPWYRAHRALTAGDAAGAAAAIVDDLRAEAPRRWRPPVAASPHQLRAVVDVLPDPLPPGNDYSERVLNDVLLATGEVARAGRYAVERFGRHRSSTAATMVARCSARLGQPDNALAWLEAAVDALAGEPDGYTTLFVATLDQAPELASLRSNPAFAAVRARA